MWTCKHCSTEVDDELAICWRCGTTIDGQLDPQFASEATVAPPPDDPSGPPQFHLRDLFFWTTLVAVVAAVGVPLIVQFFVGITCTLIGLSLLCFFIWFIFWSVIYLLTGERFMGRASRQRAAARAEALPFDVWARLQDSSPDNTQMEIRVEPNQDRP